MWNLENQRVTVLLSVFTGCTFLHIFGQSFIALLILLLISVIYVFNVQFNGYRQTLETVFEPDNFRQASRNFFYQVKHVVYQATTSYFINYLKTFFYTIIYTKMFRRKQYQLSTDTLSSPNHSLKQNSVAELSPIAKNSRHSLTNHSENNSYTIKSRFRDSIKSLDKITSTPLIDSEHRHCRNGGIYNVASKSQDFSPKRSASRYSSEHESSREDSLRSQSSTWGTSISPRMRSRAAGIKTVQTVAGPLLASTRYNIDPKVLSDVNSPGFSSRLAKYADEASTKLIHQSQYSVGQFPLVNLNATPPPILQSSRLRTPVLVRIAPPELSKCSPPEKLKSLSEMCLAEPVLKNKWQAMREISLKRHASNYDIVPDFIKKKRTDETHEEVTQKRSREEESPKAQDISSDSQLSRPTKRTKVPSNYGIINSLSSSVHVTSGVKRKADPLLCETPVPGKHFKTREESTPSPRVVNIECPCGRTFNTSGEISEKKLEIPTEKVPESPPADLPKKPESPVSVVVKEPSKSDILPARKLSERLFMTDLPAKTKKKVLEQENDGPKFLGEEDDDEISTKAVIEMREHHKLKFKALMLGQNGQESSEAETKVETLVEKSSSVNTIQNATSLSSTTSTPNTIISPITTTAPVPIIRTSKSAPSPGKHVTFQLPPSATSSYDSTAESVTSSQEAEKAPVPAPVSLAPAPAAFTTPIFNFGVPTATIVSPITPASSATVVNNVTAAPTLASTAAPANLTFNASTTFSPMNTTSASAVPTPSSTPQWSTPLSTSSSASIFGINSSQVSTGVTTTSQSTSTTPATGFSSSTTIGSSVSKSGFNFSTTLSPSSTPSKPTGEAVTSTFNFKADNTNTMTTAVATSATSTPSFFNLSGNSTVAKSFSFNTPTTTQSTSSPTAFKSSPAFAVTAAPTIAAFGSASVSNNSLFSFGAPTTSHQSMFPTNTTTTSVLTQFNAPTSSNTTAKSVTTTTPATSSSLFAGGNIFGQTKPSMFSTTTSSFTANPQPATAGFATSSGLFGTQSTPSATFGNTAMSSSTSKFGTTSATPAFGASSSTAPVFGASSAAVPAFGASANTFGSAAASSMTPVSTATATSGFGVPTTAPPSFAAATALPSFGSITTAPLFGATSSASLFSTSSATTASFGSTSSSFGSTSGFGTPSTAPPAFGATNSAFGSAALPTTSLFGSQPANAPAFGASSTSVPTFSATPSASNSTGFVFGASASQPQQPSSIFSFGESNAGALMPFSVPKPAPNTELGGINFSGSSAPGSFAGAPPTPGGMFSMGSASTSRPRSTRSRKQR